MCYFTHYCIIYFVCHGADTMVYNRWSCVIRPPGSQVVFPRSDSEVLADETGFIGGSHMELGFFALFKIELMVTLGISLAAELTSAPDDEVLARLLLCFAMMLIIYFSKFCSTSISFCLASFLFSSYLATIDAIFLNFPLLLVSLVFLLDCCQL